MNVGKKLIILPFHSRSWLWWWKQSGVSSQTGQPTPSIWWRTSPGCPADWIPCFCQTCPQFQGYSHGQPAVLPDAHQGSGESQTHAWVEPDDILSSYHEEELFCWQLSAAIMYYGYFSTKAFTRVGQGLHEAIPDTRHNRTWALS